ncbi:4'-phosphopantetheinyl transferase family protein [Almyronema epifaneia]|uniref:4'-phosphopantetheinyl transferase family protein n=1 Tax=Almyronema epifaneia S1 TaxID=2991925 RepID=A0ABW6IAH8_9CYAN
MSLTCTLATPDWQPPPADLELPAGTVHLWQIRLTSSLAQQSLWRTLLSADEHQRADQFHFERDRQHYIACRGQLRQILGRYLAIPPARVSFAYGAYGKPTLANWVSRPLSFNVSHSQAIALIAICRDRAVGVDLEYERPIAVASLAPQFFSPSEQALLLAAADQQALFFQLWTCKEAYLKATGQGISGLEQAIAELNLPAAQQVFCLTTSAANRQSWVFFPFRPAPAYTAALALQGTQAAIAYFRPTD